MRSVFPALVGEASIHYAGYLPFVNLDPITEETTVSPKLDFFNKAQPSALHKQLRK